MDDHLGLGLGDRPRHGVGIERVDHDGRRAERANGLPLRRAAGRAGHLVAACHEPGDELLAERAGGACDEDLHDVSSRLGFNP